MKKLPKDFKQITTLQALDKYLTKDQITVKITFFGGRKYEHKGNKGVLTLNDIVRMFGKIVYDSQELHHELLKNKNLVKEIKKRIKTLDIDANNELTKKGLFARLIHYILKSDVVIKEKSTYTRKDVLDEISSSVDELENKHTLKVKQVRNAFDGIRSRGSRGVAHC